MNGYRNSTVLGGYQNGYSGVQQYQNNLVGSLLSKGFDSAVSSLMSYLLA